MATTEVDDASFSYLCLDMTWLVGVFFVVTLRGTVLTFPEEDDESPILTIGKMEVGQSQ